MKNSILIILLFSGTFSFAQQEKITKLLNRQFEKEQKMYEADDFEKPKMIQPFQIKNDTLSVAFSYQTEDGEIQYFRQVNLNDIKSFEKDMNVLFIAKDGSVKETITTKNSDGMVLKTEVNDSHLFFTELRKDFKNKSLQKKITKAFAKAGYPISGEYWFD
ncbi:MAG: hypothetical protein WCY25_04080 [Moheibacter sp.]